MDKKKLCIPTYGLHGICDDVVHLQQTNHILQADAGFLLDESLKI